MPLRDKKLIIKNEKILKNKLNATKFTDYAFVPYEDIKRELLLIFSNKEKASIYAGLIKTNSTEYTKTLNEIGIIL